MMMLASPMPMTFTTLLAAVDGPHLVSGEAPQWVALMPLLPLLGAALCVVCACLNVKNKLPGILTVALLGGGFATP